jgi:hypothetical protein
MTNYCTAACGAASGEMPIVAWFGIQERYTSVERFAELKEAGINTNLTMYSSLDAAWKALDAAGAAGVKAAVGCPELQSETEETVLRLREHPALGGYHLKDEPSAADFPVLGGLVKRIQALDAGHYCYINLFPLVSGTGEDAVKLYGVPSYREYLSGYLKQIPVPFISFDHYPVHCGEDGAGRRLSGQWYANLEEIRNCGLPFWAFALATAHNNYPVPTTAELRLQMHSNLAYGAQGLQYFTYWWPDPELNHACIFYHSPIDADGRRTDVYDRVKFVNGEIQKVAGVFLGAKAVSVWHTGAQTPGNTRRLGRLPGKVKALETGDTGAIVSLLEKGTRQSLVLVNRSLQDTMKLTAVFDEDVMRVLKDGLCIPARAYSAAMEVEPGDMMIYTWENK